mgnify:CR=1 FL=1
MISLAIKRVVFSSKDNTFISCCPEDLKINHISAGNKFLKNKENRENKENKENRENRENTENINTNLITTINKDLSTYEKNKDR